MSRDGLNCMTDHDQSAIVCRSWSWPDTRLNLLAEEVKALDLLAEEVKALVEQTGLRGALCGWILVVPKLRDYYAISPSPCF